MATKRSAPAVHPSRQEQVPEEPRRKRQKPNNLGKKSFKKAHAVNDLKSQVRSLRRLLERNDDLPPTIRIEKERALRTAQHELEEEQKAKKRSDMIGQYHKIRFFDRQKATKRLKRARKELTEAATGTAEERKALERRVADAEVDVNYAIYYPLDQAYKALFPSKKQPARGGDQDGSHEPEDGEERKEVERQGDAEAWGKVKQCMADGTLDALRNGKLTGTPDGELEKREAPGEVLVTRKKRQREKETVDVHGNRRERRAAKAARKDESEDDSEGGFFE
ncbi:hypothetical protein B0A50_06713 [Salinomyces thailandicus]|uniref:rRNA-processing protein EFG1 n=1 Tax=Salinomyces thailandicus TaxID=706561 RepID=A0A4U0TQK1_9PEZI|nr:hypothetical protein B0A50_06713 [Salinomyces thailandica]